MTVVIQEADIRHMTAVSVVLMAGSLRTNKLIIDRSSVRMLHFLWNA